MIKVPYIVQSRCAHEDWETVVEFPTLEEALEFQNSYVTSVISCDIIWRVIQIHASW